MEIIWKFFGCEIMITLFDFLRLKNFNTIKLRLINLIALRWFRGKWREKGKEERYGSNQK